MFHRNLYIEVNILIGVRSSSINLSNSSTHLWQIGFKIFVSTVKPVTSVRLTQKCISLITRLQITFICSFSLPHKLIDQPPNKSICPIIFLGLKHEFDYLSRIKMYSISQNRAPHLDSRHTKTFNHAPYHVFVSLNFSTLILGSISDQWDINLHWIQVEHSKT